MGGDGRDDDESVSRGGTPVPLSDGSGATPGGGAAGSVASGASERAGVVGMRDEMTGDGDDRVDGDGNVRAAKKKRGTRAGMDRTGNRRAAAWLGHD